MRAADESARTGLAVAAIAPHLAAMLTVRHALAGLLVAALSGEPALAQATLVEVGRWGGEESDTLLGGPIAAVALGPGGRVAVSLPTRGAVLFRRQDGAPWRPLGRAGRGPGEFVRPSSLGYIGDSLWVWDGGERRLTWLGPTGTRLGVERTDERGAIVPLASGARLLFRTPSLRDLERVIEVLPPGARRWRHLATARRLPAPRLAVRTGEGSFVGVQPFAEQDLAIADGRREEVLILEPERPGRVRYRRVGVDGRERHRATLSVPLQPLTDILFDAEVARWGDAPRRHIPTSTVRKAIHRPRHLSSLRGGAVADDGTLWLRAGPEDDAHATWLRLDRAGTVVGSVRGPAALRILAVRGDDVWGALETDLGTTALVRYRVR